MRFILLVEGETERKVLPEFLKRWLDARLMQPVGIHPIKFEGWRELWDDVADRSRFHLERSPNRNQNIAVISLLDLYGPTIYPDDISTARERDAWGKKHIEKEVGRDRFRHFFAVHELEAWLLSQPTIFPPEIRDKLPKQKPEQVNFDQPPAKWLDKLYAQTPRRKYKKVTDGIQLFKKLDPEIARERCPHLKALLDEMLDLAEAAGLELVKPEAQA
jgi:hypothetical protein